MLPLGPCDPVGPCGPVAPVGPCGPLRPCGPCGPCGPGAPAAILKSKFTSYQQGTSFGAISAVTPGLPLS